MQLEHDRKKFVAVQLDWLLGYDKIREKLMTTTKHLDPIFFYYHTVPTNNPSFSISIYSKSFDPEIASCYKGYVSNKIYGESKKKKLKLYRFLIPLIFSDSLEAATSVIGKKRISMPKRQKATVKSEAELEMKTKVQRRKNNKQEKTLQNKAKKSNSSYVVDAILKIGMLVTLCVTRLLLFRLG